MIKNKYSRVAMAISIVVLILWSIMGTGTSLAWFTDTDEEINNIFHFADELLPLFTGLTHCKLLTINIMLFYISCCNNTVTYIMNKICKA